MRSKSKNDKKTLKGTFSLKNEIKCLGENWEIYCFITTHITNAWAKNNFHGPWFQVSKGFLPEHKIPERMGGFWFSIKTQSKLLLTRRH